MRTAKTGKLRFIGVVSKDGEQEAQIRISSEFCAGLKNIAAYSHLFILYWMNLRDTENERKTLLVHPKGRKSRVKIGVFACRSPSRPNPIGLCVTQLLGVDDCVLTVRGLDAFEGSPIVDIKPYVSRLDSIPAAQVSELTDKELAIRAS